MLLNNTQIYRRKYCSQSKTHLQNCTFQSSLNKSNFVRLTQHNHPIRKRACLIPKVQLRTSKCQQLSRSKKFQSDQFKSLQIVTASSFAVKYKKQLLVRIEKQQTNNTLTPLELPTKEQIFQALQKQTQSAFDYQQFFKALKQNELFFCSSCFTYVFKIQKRFHYPSCQKKIQCSTLKKCQKWNQGLEKLKLIKQMSEYINKKTEELESLYQSFIKDQQMSQQYQERHYKVLQKIKKFLTIDQINIAMHLIYQKLMKRNSNKINILQTFC